MFFVHLRHLSRILSKQPPFKAGLLIVLKVLIQVMHHAMQNQSIGQPYFNNPLLRRVLLHPSPHQQSLSQKVESVSTNLSPLGCCGKCAEWCYLSDGAKNTVSCNSHEDCLGVKSNACAGACSAQKYILRNLDLNTCCIYCF